MCDHAKFGCSRSNHVCVSSRVPAKVGGPLWPRRLGMESVAEHLKARPSLYMCYHAQFGHSSLKSVVTYWESSKLGSSLSLWDRPLLTPKNKPPLRTCYAKFGSSESKGVCINLKNSKIWEYQGLPPWSGGCGWPPTNTTHSHKNYPAECCCSRSKGTSVIKYIRLKFDPSCPVFQGRSKSSKQTTGSITQQKRW